MKINNFFATALMLLAFFAGYAQQDPQFTQFFNNRLLYNPGYAGTSNAMCGGIQFRRMWAAFDGAPLTFNATFDTKLKEIPIGLGLIAMYDKIGPMNSIFLRIPVSYILKVGPGNLGIGLDVGLMQKRISNDWITPDQNLFDNSIPGNYGLAANPDFSKLTYDISFGAFYNAPKKFYVGLSSTHLPAQTLKSTDSIQYKVTRHYYFMAGVNFALDPRNQLVPNIKVKSDISAMAIDINLLYIWNEQLMLGASYRHTDVIAPMVGFNFALPSGANLRAFLSHDYFALSKIKGHTWGSPELTLTFCQPIKIKKITTYGDDLFFN
ncbi:MAG: type IX secretion system membrane protein PorP/SprF [Bacteroidia bacterium]|nr:type IX secretion system membrane protein PorP/SprF [Bacteroidia bacterium]